MGKLPTAEEHWSALNMSADGWKVDSEGSGPLDLIRADRLAVAEHVVKWAAREVPGNWLDPLLTGDDSIETKGCEGLIVALLNAVRDRIRTPLSDPDRLRRVVEGEE